MTQGINPYAGKSSALPTNDPAPTLQMDVGTSHVEPLPGPTSTDDDVPVGTIAEVLRWVGDDVDRAVLALETEMENDRLKRRKRLIAHLEEMIK